MSVSGDWALHYSWGCTGAYVQVAITFNSDGTFDGSFTGRWVQRLGTLLLSFDDGPALYGGTVTGSVGNGAMSAFDGQTGCWYLTQESMVGLAPTGGGKADAQQSRDAAGNMRSR